MENLKEMKQWLKENGALIKESKIEMKNTMSNGDYAGGIQNTIENQKFTYRHYHIAYSLAKGKTYEQIENRVRIGNEPNWTFIKRILCDLNNTTREEILERITRDIPDIKGIRSILEGIAS